ncbi:hypothetical protein LY632_07355 [Erythrobacter sp. SDW2]|uniref:hypothetical protein n=1 Tax=Erythrobacter sp. SDW2 TaxID=2907154 RepID=UPI001F1693F3|nr:hypothetical protein [Erythrobacter sp. SDW2]UIP05537.1 hypothetical protein LY632_07355 [Erythrobacter sp. SDW2]
MDDGALPYVMWVAQIEHGCTDAAPESAIAQDLGIYGLDIDDFAMKLAERFGAWVFDWPWDRYTELNEGTDVTGCLALPFTPIIALVRMSKGLPLRREKQRIERLELRHIARVLEAGEWIDP